MERAPEGENLTEKDLIRKMKQIDKIRAQTREVLSGSSWGQRDAYHVTINTSDWNIKDMAPAVASGFFTALNDGVTSAMISFLRTLVFQSAAVMILPLIWGIHGVWISIVVAEFMAVVLGAGFLVAKQKKYHY